MRLVLDARTAAFAAAVDTAAGSDPQVTMAEALVRHRDLVESHDGWAVGVLTAPTSRLEELAGAATSSFRRGDPPVRLGVTTDMGLGPAMSVTLDFHREMSPALEVVRVDVGVGGSGEIAGAVEATSALDSTTSVFVRLSLADTPSVRRVRSALREVGRSGGISVLDSTADAMGHAVWEASYADVPIVIDTGDLRAVSSAAGATTGVVNTILASTAAHAGERRAVVEGILTETDPGAFTVGAAMWGWRDLTFPGSAISGARSSGVHAIVARHPESLIAELAGLDALGAGS